MAKNTLYDRARALKLVSKTPIWCSISYIFCVKKYAVVLPHEATENLK